MIFETAQKTYEPPARVSGILLHPTSLPSPYGIGDLGNEAYKFVDFLEKAGQHLWQVLPLTPTGFGNSPYQSLSAFAGQPLLISPGHLLELGLLDPCDLENCPCENPVFTDYDSIIPWKTAVLKKAYENYRHTSDKMLLEEYDSFYENNQFWLDDYALFMACKELHDGAGWTQWEPEYQNPTPEFRVKLKAELKDKLYYFKFIQFIFFKEWYALKEYANKKNVKIIGDIPIFVSMDSADVWANQHLFQLDSKGFPTAVAGVPPDYFSETGQLWGNPLYNWKAHKKDGYKWWISRIRNQLDLLDYLRIDHFRGFEAYWAVPYGETTAINGKWRPGPKESLFLAIEHALGSNLPIIAEDLGIITPEVERLRNQFGFPGMKVLQFAFEAENESSFLPHQFTTTNCVCYTGTHDNDTTRGWYDSANERSRDKVRRYMNTDGGTVNMDFIRTCLGTIAAYAVFPLQDLLGIGTEGRMNTPGTAEGNWSWRYEKDILTDELAETLLQISHLYGRY